MHSVIIQVSTSPIPNDELVDNISFPERLYYDILADYIGDEEEDDIMYSHLSDLPPGLITINKESRCIHVTEDDSLFESVISNHISTIQRLASEVSTHDYGTTLYRLSKSLRKLSSNDTIFYFEDSAYHDFEFIRSLRYYKGQTLYLGSCLDYHY